MRATRYIFTAVLFLILCQFSSPAFCQQGISFDLKKPKEYEERVLRSEKSDQKKFTLPRRLVQNTITHYNFYFNANNKLNDVLERAKTAFVDDYSTLIPFYNYSLDRTAADSIQLDSITFKSSTGIALHDLRNDWVDNLYLLWGASYYLQKKFDSAYLMFQFINYAFAPKEKDGYYITIGSNRDGTSANSISTKEKGGLPRKILGEPPSRNDAFIWQIRNFLAQDQFPEAASLIVSLRNDPVFPGRLKNDLEEVQALWFYKQNMWDSSAAHLVNAFDNATTKQEKARWEYLAAQMYELAGKNKEAEKLYSKVSAHTTDPVMDIYARLFAVRSNKDEGEKAIEKNVAELVKMAKRDKYADYRDIIYYMAAQMLLEGKDVDGALALLLKSTQYTSANAAQRNKAFLQLAELSYGKKLYRPAYNFYDSLKLDEPSLKNPEAIKARKEMLGRLSASLGTMDRQDSLQRIAALPENERSDFIKKMVKQLRRQQGLKDEAPLSTGTFLTTTNAPPLFPSDNQKGEWYFYNPAFRTSGQNEFKNRWGNRPNIDNWRRSSAATGVITNNNVTQNDNQKIASGNQTATNDLSFDGLSANLPLTEELLKASNDSIQNALFIIGKIYIQEIEDCAAGTNTFEELRSHFTAFEKMDEVLFNLYYCYNKNGETAKAAAIKKLMSEKYSNSNFTSIVTTGKNPASANAEATSTYEKIYDLFIEGSFDQAVAQKKEADKIYGKNFWTPQLLYIEAVYYIKQRNDSTATDVLNSIISQFANTPLAGKAANLISVLKRRKEIETELTNLVVTRNEDSTTTFTTPVTKPVVTAPPVKDTSAIVKTQPVVPVNNPPKDSTVTKPAIPVNTAFSYKPNEAHYVMLVLTKVDPVFVNEAKNAFVRYNKDTYYNKTFTVDLFELNPDNRLLLIAPFKTAQEAIDYIEKTRPKTATEILPWLKGGKYSFSILDNTNFEVLKNTKDIEKYKEFINQQLPGKF